MAHDGEKGVVQVMRWEWHMMGKGCGVGGEVGVLLNGSRVWRRLGG